VTAFTWARILDAGSRVSMRVAVEDGEMLGFAIHHYHDSTWDIAPEGYLEDLYVDETTRGKGVGRALVDDLIVISKRNGWRGIDSYIKSDGHIRYRLRT
jgi:GNAT superfamily N-acetyltransferase